MRARVIEKSENSITVESYSNPLWWLDQETRSIVTMPLNEEFNDVNVGDIIEI